MFEAHITLPATYFSSPAAAPDSEPRFAATPPVKPAAPAWPAIACTLYLAVSFAFLVRILLGYRLTRRLVGNSELVSDPRARDLVEELACPRVRPEIRESGAVLVPLTVGWRRPVILLTRDWCAWDEWKLRAVLAHELAHIRRRDWLMTLLASLNKCVFWFHPLAWWFERRLAALAEQASDEASLLANGDAARYAEVVLEFAAGVKGRRLVLEGGAMACSRNVTGRINRILDLRRAGPGQSAITVDIAFKLNGSRDARQRPSA